MKIPSLVLVLYGVLTIALSSAERRPNILVVLADDFGWGDVSCYGSKVPTPALDRMAREGTRFTQFYVASPICSPSCCGLLTGQQPGKWRITSYLQTRKGNRECGQADFLDPAAPSLPRVLKSAGYATAHIGKWHLGGGRDVTNAPEFAAYQRPVHRLAAWRRSRWPRRYDERFYRVGFVSNPLRPCRCGFTESLHQRR